MERETLKLRKPVESGCRKQDRGDAIEGSLGSTLKKMGRLRDYVSRQRVNF